MKITNPFKRNRAAVPTAKTVAIPTPSGMKSLDVDHLSKLTDKPAMPYPSTEEVLKMLDELYITAQYTHPLPQALKDRVDQLLLRARQS